MTLSELAKLLEPIYQRNTLAYLGGGLFDAVRTYGATRAQANAGNNALATLLGMHWQTRADLEPWRTSGVGALNNLSALTKPNQPFNSSMLLPGYAFRFSEQQRALDNADKASGMFYSGRHLKDQSRLAQNFAGNEFGDTYNLHAGLSGTGQTAATTPWNIASDSKLPERLSKLYGEIGNSNASGYMGVGNSLTRGLGNALNSYAEWGALDRAAQASR